MTVQTCNNKPNEAEGLAFPLSGNEKLIDALAKIQCAIEGRTHGFSLDEVVAPGIERWTRHRYEAEILLRDIREAGYVFEEAHAKELDALRAAGEVKR